MDWPFHFCLFAPRACAVELSMRVAVLRGGAWSRVLNLPGYWKKEAEMLSCETTESPRVSTYACGHMTVSGIGLVSVPRCSMCGGVEMSRAATTATV